MEPDEDVVRAQSSECARIRRSPAPAANDTRPASGGVAPGPGARTAAGARFSEEFECTPTPH
jgi:hypothetical protein